MSNEDRIASRRKKNFEKAKAEVLGKRDKSFAGRIDPRAVEICAVINIREEFYTTSSCSGRSYLYQGTGVKSSTDFRRFRISHDRIGAEKSARYFDLTTLQSDPTGGADPIRTVGQFDHGERVRQVSQQPTADSPTGPDNARELESAKIESNGQCSIVAQDGAYAISGECLEKNNPMIWMRYEPFILHVACRSMSSASALMAACRGPFKNCGLTTWKDETRRNSQSSRYMLAVNGDEGLDMPLTCPDGSHPFADNHEWLKEVLNDLHQRNWDKMERFVQAVRNMPEIIDEDEEGDQYAESNFNCKSKPPKSFDVVGDVAVLNTLPSGDDVELREIGESIMKKNKGIKIVVARRSNLEGTERAPGTEGFRVLAGAANRNPLMTTHCEYGIKCVVNLNRTFYSPRMGPERLRICQQVARGENVLVLFAGVGMEALQIAGRTEATSVVAIELNPVAVECFVRGQQLLSRNRAVKCIGAVERLRILQGDVLEILPTLPLYHFDRILAPRPKEGISDGDLGAGDGGAAYLEALLPLMKQDGGECHWYDFAADHEFPACTRTCELITRTCERNCLTVEVIHISNAGSVAMRQLRVCVDFRISSSQVAMNNKK